MGALLSLTFSNTPDPGVNVFVDFENAQPTEFEMDTYKRVQKTLEASASIIDILKNYKGSSEVIRQAISNPSKETERNAWEALKPCIAQLKEIYDFSGVISECGPILLSILGKGEPLQNLEKNQALAKQFADLLHFVLSFDDLKMGNPNIQNDFSYYRRTLSKLKAGNELLAHVVVKDELANKMSLFYAYPTPMLRALIEATSNFMKKDSTITEDSVTECLSAMISVCLNAISKDRIVNKETRYYILRVMVGFVVLYDHLHPEGAFIKSSPINIRNVVKTIETELGDQATSLINALRYSTKHLNEESTPKPIKALFQN